jgi:hypothetical protein
VITLISIDQKGDFKKLSSFLEKSKEVFNLGILDKYGKQGVIALQEATPKDTGETSRLWSYKISRNNGLISLSFHNSNVNKGFPIAIILQYGHATGNGGYVKGVDYINPALEPIFNKIAEEAWREVQK